ncbi:MULTISPECIES: triose-phosphate isomerase [Helicobacter]|uniref:Triosephosphate isomerase n=3 Tax=Helicobacter TaxID=209 RepID=A0A377J289_9HELI|nr:MULTISPECIES: triose-phosphate isomerase [Helicobacter]MDL0079664.1 triose-phosphate isomerase [Helicobacter sp. CPD2-1]MDL0081439.1 triose-phosphate isomerase [Helicobacter sp. XJK30-2]STO96560.1 triosephosphate isomerase [Helicobacter canis]
MQFMANFKCNHTAHSVQEYFTTLGALGFSQEFLRENELVFFPQALSLQASKDFAPFGEIGVQNAYPAYSGAFTGEIGVQALESMGVRTILIGHSERRVLLNESQEFIAEKFAFFARLGFFIVYCVGEPLSVRKQGEKAVQEYLQAQFAGIDVESTRVSVAYEPIWAIGTGRSASVQEIAQTHAFLRTLVQNPLLYGGSVNASNAKEILSIPNVNGVLVGSASLDAKSFYAITQSVLA